MATVKAAATKAKATKKATKKATQKVTSKRVPVQKAKAVTLPTEPYTTTRLIMSVPACSGEFHAFLADMGITGADTNSDTPILLSRILATKSRQAGMKSPLKRIAWLTGAGCVRPASVAADISKLESTSYLAIKVCLTADKATVQKILAL